MKKSSYLYLSLAVILLLSFGLVKHLLAADCPIETVGLSRDTYNDLKNNPAIINEVKALQTIFSKIPNIGWQNNYQITGNFGFGTEALLRRFQKAYKLNSTGVLDQATIQKLCEIWAYQNKVYTPSGTTAGTTEKTSYQQKTTDGTQYQQQTNETAGGTAGTYSQGSTDGASTKCVHKVCAEPGFCKDKNNWCCIYYQESSKFDWKPGEPCVDECESDQYCVDVIKERKEASKDPRFAYDYKECYRYKCDNNTYTCQKVFDTYVKKDQKCPAELNPSLNKCTPPDIGCKQTDVKKCVRGKCYLFAPKEQYKYECGIQTLNVPLDQACPASECQHQTGDGLIGNPMSQDCERLYGAWKNMGKGGYCYVGKCDSNTHKCNTEKVYPDPGKTCDDYTSECANNNDCLPKPKSDYYFDSTACECKEDSTKGKLTLSECELKKAEAIQKQEGGCKGYQTSEDWLKTVDCSLGNYTGSQPEFECGQKLGCKWCPECVYESRIGGEHNLPRGDQSLGRGMFTGYPGGKCIKINETCAGTWTKGRCGAQCSVPQGKTVSDKNPVECTTGSYWGDKWAENNCDDPKTCEAVCLLGGCEYTDKPFRESCPLNKTYEQCMGSGSCAWVHECRGSTWYYVGDLTINTCVPGSWYSMTDYTYKCVKGKCNAQCGDDSDCGPGNRCNFYCKCVSEGDCIGDSDLGDPLVYGECRNGSVKNPSDYVWKDSCNGPKTLIEATLTDKTNCSCGHQTFDCSQILVNGTCKDGKCVSSTEGKKTYCGCQNFQKICKIEEEGGGNIGEKIECRPGDTSNCPSCKKSCDWAKCEEKTTSDWRCKSYYKEVSKEEQCPESDPSCIDRVNNKPCTPPKCTDFTGYRCLTEDKCDSNFKKTEKYGCTGQTVCCKEKTTTPTKCTDFLGYSCLAEDKCAPDTKKTEKYDCTGQTVCCKGKSPTTVNYSKCDKTSYTSLGIKYWTYACSSTSNPQEDDRCVGKTGNELVEYCTNLHGPLPPPSTSTSTLTGCLDNKAKISVEKTYCDYSNCSNLGFNYSTIIAFIRNIIAGTTPPVQTGKCVKTGQYIEVCPEKADEVHQCGTSTDCPCPTGGETCSSKYPGYECVSSPSENCEPGTSKGSILDCQPNNQVCCKSQVICWQLDKVCLPESQCQPNSIESLQHGCESGFKCCKKETSTTAKCSDYSNLGYQCLYSSDCEVQTIMGTLDCGNKFCCKKKSATPSKCSDYSGYECLDYTNCEANTNIGVLNCTSGTVCCKKKSTTTAKCSDYSNLGYQCLYSSDCEVQTIMGTLDCGNKFCCKKKSTTPSKCSDYSGYECLDYTNCEANTNIGVLNCTSGTVCCKKKTTTTGQWCESCSNLSHCTRVKWYDSDGGCNDNWYNQRTTWADDSCESYYPCDAGQHCQGGVCTSSGTTAKCSDYSGYECLSSSDCESGTDKGQLNCSSGKVCCKKKTTTTNFPPIHCERCSNTKPCQYAFWTIPHDKCDVGIETVCCSKDPLALGISVSYRIDDTCPEKGGKPCDSGYKCKNGSCVENKSCSNYGDDYECRNKLDCDLTTIKSNTECVASFNEYCCKKDKLCEELGKQCLGEASCEPNTIEPSQRGCTPGLHCCKKKSTNTFSIKCERCSNTKPCQYASWIIPPGKCDSDDEKVCCGKDPVALGISVSYSADDYCPEKGGKPCPSGQKCKNGSCVSQ